MFLKNIHSFVHLRKNPLDSDRETLSRILTLDRNWIISSGEKLLQIQRARSGETFLRKVPRNRRKSKKQRNEHPGWSSRLFEQEATTKRSANVFECFRWTCNERATTSSTCNEADFQRQNRLAASFIPSAGRASAMSIFRNCITTRRKLSARSFSLLLLFVVRYRCLSRRKTSSHGIAMRGPWFKIKIFQLRRDFSGN